MYRLRFLCCGKRVWELRSSLLTLLLGCCVLVLLHFLIMNETVDQGVYFASLPLPEDPGLAPLGVMAVEELPNSGSSRLPRRIHQTWKTEQIPHSMIAWIKSWTKNHPDWEYWLWTDSSARQLIKERFPNLLHVYDAYPNNIQRADALRYVVLHEFGGVYADLDMESLKPLDPLTFRYSCFVGQEPYVHPIMDTNTQTLVINAFMACQQKHPFLKMVVDTLPDFAHMWSFLDSTGPHFLSYVFQKYTRDHPQYPPEHVNGTYLAPAEYFYPNIDPEKFGYVYKKCADYNTLSALQRRACHSLKRSRPEAERRLLAFTDHHWIHTYLSVKVSLRKPVPIQDVVPDVKIYS
ncbi:uncharacterized protein LOC143297344 isoform X2 [Babylonia areolata]|uniref:uncharacterized protein LOC143297344 isoform X2 n=1 Tax=Babylonia areolata TaxID=304850 RepID=UPI003FD17E1A